MLTTITLKDFRETVIRDEELNQLLSKECTVNVEEATESIYANIKALTLEYGGFLKPLTVVVLEGQSETEGVSPRQLHLIDGFTRYQVLEELYQEGIAEDSFTFTLNIVEPSNINKENFVEQAKVLMWKLTKASRGSVNDPKLDTLMIGTEYHNTKKADNGFREKSVIERVLSLPHGASGLSACSTAKTLADKNKARGWTEKKVRNAGALIKNLQVIAAMYNKPANHFYYLYRSGLSLATIAEVASITSDADKRKVKSIIDKGAVLDLATFVSEQKKAAKAQLRLERELKERRNWAEETIPNLSKLIDFYITSGELSKADILKVKSLFSKVKSGDLEIITSMAESISSKASYNNFFSSVYKQYQYLDRVGNTQKALPDPSFKVKDSKVKDTVPSSANQPAAHRSSSVVDYSDYEPDYTVDTEEQTYERDKVKIALRHIRSAIQALETCETTLDLEDSLINVELKAEVLLGELNEK